VNCTVGAACTEEIKSRRSRNLHAVMLFPFWLMRLS
jgi:hypothetical protein